MILFNRLVRTDLILLIAVISMLFVKSAAWKDGLMGCGAALFIFSIYNHVRHYNSYKKFY
jgi:hypothetical protein